MYDDAALIALDWGSTRLRGYLLAADGRVLERRDSDAGALRLGADGERFGAALAALCRDWPALPRIACGMVGSRQGWRETPYLSCPVTPARLAAALCRVDIDDAAPLWLIPGVDLRDADSVDVIRGEETQLAGVIGAGASDAADAARLCVLPGTHSKWALLDGGRLSWFTTFMSGELFALLTRHGSIGALCDGAAAADADSAGSVPFGRGLARAADAPLRQLFGVRARALFGELAPGEIADYLSGLLIGAEVREGLACCPRPAGRPLLIGAPALAARYRRAFAAVGVDTDSADADAAARGLWRIARGAGLC